MPTTPEYPDLPHGVVGEPTGGPPKMTRDELDRIAREGAGTGAASRRRPWWKRLLGGKEPGPG